MSLVGDITQDPNSVQAILDGIQLVPNPMQAGVYGNEIMFNATNLNNDDHTLNVSFVGPLETHEGAPNSLVLQYLK